MGGYLRLRPRQFNADADALEKGALSENWVYSRWSPLAFTYLLYDPSRLSCHHPHLRHLHSLHVVIHACGARLMVLLRQIVVELMGASFSSALVAFLIDFSKKLAWTETFRMHARLRKLNSYGCCMLSSTLPWWCTGGGIESLHVDS